MTFLLLTFAYLALFTLAYRACDRAAGKLFPRRNKRGHRLGRLLPIGGAVKRVL